MADNLLDQVSRLRKQTETQTKDRQLDAKYSRSARAREDIAKTGRFTFQLWQAILVLRQWIVIPTAEWLVWLIRHTVRGYRRLWAYTVYRRTTDGVLLFSKTRAAGFLLASGLFCWYAMIPLAVFTLDGVVYSVSAQHNEKMYLFGSQEIDPATGAHNIEGADHMPWTPEDSMYFRAEDDMFSNVWSLTHKGVLYWPENIGAAVPYGYNWCTVSYYGFRLRFWGVKNSFMRVLDVSCVPLANKPPDGATENR